MDDEVVIKDHDSGKTTRILRKEVSHIPTLSDILEKYLSIVVCQQFHTKFCFILLLGRLGYYPVEYQVGILIPDWLIIIVVGIVP